MTPPDGAVSVRVPDAGSQYFTPPWLADRVVSWAGVGPGSRVLVPCAGTGVFAASASRLGAVATAVELSGRLVDVINSRRAGIDVIQADFIDWEDPRKFDVAIMHPPAIHNRELHFVRRAFAFTDRVVALCSVKTEFYHGTVRDTLFDCGFGSIRRRVSITRKVKFSNATKAVGLERGNMCVYEFVRGTLGSVLTERW